jgi:exopolyphosphatase/guanosine-5'-triphosphate,3'-diphosphate pyrophosphatase
MGQQAVIDIGSNSILLLVASRDASGNLEIERDLNRVARLSEGVHERGTLSDAAIERALTILREYRGMCDELGVPVRAVATEGVRMASDRERFLGPASEILRAPVEAISGVEEARLSYLSVAREELEDRPIRVIDIGGASTELVHGEGETIISARSHRIGSVRLTERCVSDREGAVPPEAVAKIESLSSEAFASQPLDPAPRLYGLAGTVTSCAALLLELEVYDRDRVDGTRFDYQRLVELRDRMASWTNAQRVERTLLPAKRADVVVAGASILLSAMRHCGAQTLVVRDRGLRYALIESHENL